jgi:Lrp/AsnC family transcriptional regulator for asnA, asnC and gidA
MNGGPRALRPLESVSGLTEFELAVVGMLQHNGRRPYRQIALELGTSEKQIRTIVRRLQDSGLIQITAVTFPPLLGYRGMANVALRIDAGHRLQDAAEAMTRIEAVDYVSITSGRYDLFVDLVCRDRPALLACLEDEVRTVPGLESIQTFLYLDFPYQAPRGLGPLVAPAPQPAETPTFNDVDRSIVDELVADGRVPYPEIARRLDVSEAQVRQRVKRLTEAGAIRITAITNPETLGFDTMAWVGIRTGKVALADTTRMLTDLTSCTYVAAVAGEFDVFAELVCADEAELRDQLSLIHTSDLVTHAEPFVYLDLYYKRMRLP